MSDAPRKTKLRDVELRKGKRSRFIVALPCDERDARNFPLLDEFLWIIHQENAICTGNPGERKRLCDNLLTATKQ
jgi:hypothetical protein